MSGFTKIPNWLLDEVMPKCDPNEWRVVCAIARQTIGWGKAADKISLSQFQTLTGIGSRPTVTNAIESALNNGFIHRKKCGQSYLYGLETKPVSSLETKPVDNKWFRNQTSTGLETKPQLVQKLNTQKKERKEKKEKAAAARDTTQNVFSLFENNIGAMTPIIAESIGEWLDDLGDKGDEWVGDAIVEAAKNNGRSWKYIEAILKRWERDGRVPREFGSKKNGKGELPALVVDESGVY